MQVVESKDFHLYDESQTLKLRLALCVSCDGEMGQCLISASKDVLVYLDAPHLKAVKSQFNFRESFHGGFTLLVQCLQTLFTQGIAAAFKSVDEFEREALVELCGSISKCKAATKGSASQIGR